MKVISEESMDVEKNLNDFGKKKKSGEKNFLTYISPINDSWIPPNILENERENFSLHKYLFLEKQLLKNCFRLEASTFV